MANDLYLHHEVLLLALRDDKGTTTSSMYAYAMAGAMLSELLLHERIVCSEDKKQIVAVVNDESMGDPLLDELLQMIGESTKHRAATHWVTKAASIKKLHHRVAAPLCEKGILKADERKILFLFTQKVYPELEGSFEDAIRLRMASVMFDDSKLPDERTAVLVALASASGLMRYNFAPVELKQHALRIKKLAKGELLAAGATRAAIEAVQAAVMVAVMIPAVVAATQ